MRRLPIYFLVDVSESMVGTPIEHVQDGMASIINELRTDPYALETAWVSVIAFAGKAKMLSPLEELYKFYPPKFPIGGGTSLGTALNFLMDEMDQSLQRTTMEVKGDWKPIIFLFTDGNPTDSVDQAFDRWNNKYRCHCNLIIVSIGDNVNTQLMGRISENVLRLTETNAQSFREFFKWVTASIKTSSVSVTDAGDDDVKLAPMNGINLENTYLRYKGKTMEEAGLTAHDAFSDIKATYAIFVAQQRKQKYGPEKMYGEDNAVADYDFGGKMVPCMNIGKYRNVPLEYIAEHDQSYLQWCVSDKCNFMPASKKFIQQYIN